MDSAAEAFTIVSVFILSIFEVFSTMTKSRSGDKNKPYRKPEKPILTKIAGRKPLRERYIQSVSLSATCRKVGYWRKVSDDLVLTRLQKLKQKDCFALLDNNEQKWAQGNLNM